jgi:hypothetical protein
MCNTTAFLSAPLIFSKELNGFSESDIYLLLLLRRGGINNARHGGCDSITINIVQGMLSGSFAQN